MMDKNASNQSGGSFSANSFSTYPTSRVSKVTSITREFDEDGNLVKEVETVTEYERTPVYPNPYPQPAWQNPVISYTTNGSPNSN